MASTQTQTGYAPVGDVEMYYEVHGDGRPLVLLHGAYMTAEMMAPLVKGLVGERKVVVPELQGHGRTALGERALSYEQMADDVAELIGRLELGQADVVGYSMGAAAALQLGIRHPELVRRLVVVSAAYSTDGVHKAAMDMFPTITPELFAGSPMETEFQRLNPHPEDFPRLVERLVALDSVHFAWPEEAIRAIPAPMLIVAGDSDVVTLEHVVGMFKLRDGGVMGDLSGMPASQLAILPGTSHFIPPGCGVLDRLDWLLGMVRTFLDPPEVSAEPG